MNEEITQLKSEIEEALKQLKIAEIEKERASLQNDMAAPDFWNDRSSAERKSRREAHLGKIIEPWRELERDVQTLVELSRMQDDSLEAEMQKSLKRSQKQFEKLALNLRLSGKYDGNDAILSIHAGTGGTDAMDWAQMLMRMYLRFADSMDWKTEIVDESAGDEAGIKSVTMRVIGDFAYGRLAAEHGVHRLVRLSPFNSDNLRQTSFALVEVVPEIDEPDEVAIDESDLKVDVYRAGGKGGQSVNTTDSAVRITHEPTGIVVAIQNERSQLQNKETALKILRSKLAQLAEQQHAEKMSELKGPDQQAAWGNQIRNYVLHPYSLVKDTRTNHETSDTQGVLDGDIEQFIDAYLKQV